MKQTGFILKVLGISAGLSFLIKHEAPILSISATPTNALIAVFVPTLIMAIALLGRTLKERQLN